MRRYLKWDYDNDTVTEYQRQGECNMCGQCCKAYIGYKYAGRLTKGAAPMGDNLLREGVWSEIQQGKMRRFIQLAVIKDQGEHICPSFTEQGCGAHATKSLTLGGNLALCEAWPIIPEHVSPFDQCSYTFVVIGQWKISDLPFTPAGSNA